MTVTTAGGTSATGAADQYTYIAAPPAPTVTGVSPTSGPTAGGTSVTITGTNFTGASAVKFGATAGHDLHGEQRTTITATAPAGTGTVDVTVTTAGGTSATNADDQYTYIDGRRPASIPSPVAGGWQLNGSAQLVTSRVAGQPAADAGHELAGGLGVLARAGARGRRLRRVRRVHRSAARAPTG